MNLENILEKEPFILTEGSLIERLRRNPEIEMHPDILNAGLVYDPQGAKILADLYREYLDIGEEYDLPMLAYTPTWRANADRIRSNRYHNTKDVNGDCFRFLTSIRQEYGDYAKRIFIGGLVGCRGDAYRPQDCLSMNEAASFHEYQVARLCSAGVDFLVAQTLPCIDEAMGLSMAMAEHELPYIIGFILRPNGDLLDGVPLDEAIQMLDEQVHPRPCFYLANCIHPKIFESAMAAQCSRGESIAKRIIGLQANTSKKSPEELEDLPYLDTEEAAVFGKLMISLHRRFGTKVLGGCCGTDNRHIASIAEQIKGVMQRGNTC
jgi:homocysteine S-methyltransferase